MATSEQKQKPADAGGGDDAAAQPASMKDKSDSLKEDLDELLDEIDEVLEKNAAEFVKNFVQRGGE
jgi:ubiquitin-like protein Pup